jgi:Mak10 subunit, NatC N(alpha)-terminal acetyltransferase
MDTWEDVTELCKLASKSLDERNPMMHNENFSLFDSMSAVELLDPKMDQCCGVTGRIDTQSLLSIEPLAPLTTEGAAKIMSILINYEVAYLDGIAVILLPKRHISPPLYIFRCEHSRKLASV